MALTVTATWLPDNYGYSLSAAGSTGAVTWYRSAYWSDGRYRNTNIGTGATLLDLGVPLDGATITYTAADSTAIVETTVTPPQAAGPVLGLLDSVEVPAAQVVVESAREQAVAGRGSFYEVLDRNEPYVEPLRPIERTGQMTLRINHPGGAFPGPILDRLRRMLRTGQILTLRSTCTQNVEDVTFVATSWTESHTGSGNEHGPDRKITLDWRAVAPMWGADTGVGGRVWAMVPVEFGTWADVVASGKTWEQLAAGD